MGDIVLQLSRVRVLAVEDGGAMLTLKHWRRRSMCTPSVSTAAAGTLDTVGDAIIDTSSATPPPPPPQQKPSPSQKLPRPDAVDDGIAATSTGINDDDDDDDNDDDDDDDNDDDSDDDE